MRISARGLALWALYGAFAAYAVAAGWQDTTFSFSGPLAGLKAVVWLLLLGFLGYSIYCTFHEDLFRTVRSIATFHWGRQIGLDLYLGLFIGLVLIYLNDGAVTALIWLIPVLLYANLAVLLYVAIHFESIVTRFLAF